ncbi:MAG: HyaD/HybD family hydrogenase maturation endopeptidase [Acidobacteriaceae bacterium]|nr:HyaD/HybD family hydrogenase maturation endopeptidase [Acidobacteriaceae bacterium]
MSHEIAVLGLGNLIRSDDGLGVHAIRRLLVDHRLLPDVEVIDGGTLGLDLLPRVEGASHLLVIDAVDFGAPPGTLCRFADQQLQTLSAGRSVHLLGFSDLLNALHLLGSPPRRVVLLGIQPGSTNWGITLSPSVVASLDRLVEAALSELTSWLHSEPLAAISRA